ncbi:MAG: hypothetical protein OHK0039_25050 [Bacteroidia bacterium]
MHKLLLILLLPGSLVFGQRSTMHALALSDLYAGEAIDVIDLRPHEAASSAYWHEDWCDGAVLLKNQHHIKGYPLRYELLSEQIEFMAGGTIRVLPTTSVRELSVDREGRRERYVSPALHYDQPQLPDRLHLLHADGRICLLEGRAWELIKANYVSALDVGSITDKIAVYPRFYLWNGTYWEQLAKSATARREQLERLSGWVLADYLKIHHLNLRSTDDLIAVCQYLNE